MRQRQEGHSVAATTKQAPAASSTRVEPRSYRPAINCALPAVVLMSFLAYILARAVPSLLWGRGGDETSLLQFSPYDVVIEADDLLHIVHRSDGSPPGWPILSRHASAVEKLLHANDINSVAVVGLYNRGKSHLLSRLSGVAFPQGISVHTSGLSVLYPRNDDKTLYIDTAGSDQPVVDVASPVVDPVLRGRASEAYLREAVIFLADLVIIVVNSLTLSDQVYVRQIKEIVASELRGDDTMHHLHQRLLVVHNLKDFHSEAAVEQRIERDVVMAFNASRSGRSAADHVWKDNNGVLHLVLAQEDSPAAKVYNAATVQFIHSRLGQLLQSKHADTKASLPPFLERFRDYTTRALPMYFERQESARSTTPAEPLVGVHLPAHYVDASGANSSCARAHRSDQHAERWCSPRFVMRKSIMHDIGMLPRLRRLQFDGPMVVRVSSNVLPSAMATEVVLDDKRFALVMIDAPGLATAQLIRQMPAQDQPAWEALPGAALRCTTKRAYANCTLAAPLGNSTVAVLGLRVELHERAGFPPHVSFWLVRYKPGLGLPVGGQGVDSVGEHNRAEAIQAMTVGSRIRPITFGPICGTKPGSTCKVPLAAVGAPCVYESPRFAYAAGVVHVLVPIMCDD